MRLLALVSLVTLVGCDSEPDGPLPIDAQEDGVHGRIETQGGRDVLYLWGTREEMGYAEGALYCDRVPGLFKDYLLEHLVAEHSDYPYEVARAFVLAETRYEDADLAELTAMYQGMIDTCTPEQLTVESTFLDPREGGSRVLELEDLLFANAVADFGCSSFTVWGNASATGDTIHGRNFDWAIDPQGTFVQSHMLKVYDSTDEGARWASVSVPSLAGCLSCVTDEGVSLTMHNVSGLDPEYDVDISPRMYAARAALAATSGANDVVAAAEEVLEARRQYTGNNLHLAFPLARGAGIGGVVFEYDGGATHADGQVTVRRPGQDPDMVRTDAIVAANHYIVREAPETSGDSFDRLASLRADIDAFEASNGGVEAANGRGMLEAVENGYSGITAHSIVVDTANRQLQLFVAATSTSPAPESEPITYDLDVLFGGLP